MGRIVLKQRSHFKPILHFRKAKLNAVHYNVTKI